jgi:CHAD domain-containing protein
VKGIALPSAADLLAEPAGGGTRRVALALLGAAVAGRDRLEDPTDAEALHDFRVALRRTRSWIKAFEDELGSSIRKKHRRRLAAISQAAGAARDAQVHAAWLRDVEDSLRARDRPGAEWLLHRVMEQQREADAALGSIVAEEFAATATSVASDLAVYTVRIDLRNPLAPATLGQAMAPRVLALAAALGDRLSAVQSMQDQAVAHAARIAGKRLRYVVEPIAEGVEGGPALVKRLRILQDVIGEMHDVHVVAEEVIQAAEEAGADQARRVATALLEGESADEAVRSERARDPRPGLLAIAAQLRARGQSAFRELQQGWLGEHAGELTAAARMLAARLMGDIIDDQQGRAGDSPVLIAPSATAMTDPPGVSAPESDGTHLEPAAEVPGADRHSPGRGEPTKHPVSDQPAATAPSGGLPEAAPMAVIQNSVAESVPDHSTRPHLAIEDDTVSV